MQWLMDSVGIIHKVEYPASCLLETIKDSGDLDLHKPHKDPGKLTYVNDILKVQWIGLAKSLVILKRRRKE